VGARNFGLANEPVDLQPGPPAGPGQQGEMRGTREPRRHARSICGVLYLGVCLLARPAAACPGTSTANGIDGTAYNCTANLDAANCVTAGNLSEVKGVFHSPERTGVAVAASERLGFTVKCAQVADAGVTGDNTATVTVKGCYSTPAFTVGGLGAVVVSSTSSATACPPADCSCSVANGLLTGNTGTFTPSKSWDHDDDEVQANWRTCDHDNDELQANWKTCDHDNDEVEANWTTCNHDNNTETPDQASAACATPQTASINCATARIADAACASVQIACNCTCMQYTCTKLESLDGKKSEISGGNAVQAGHTEKAAGTCVISGSCPSGLLDGATYTAFTGSIGVTLQDAGMTDRSTHLDGTTPTKSSGVYIFPDLHVDGLAIHTNELTVTFTATGTSKHQNAAGTYADGAVTATRGTFKVYPTSWRFVQAASGNPGTVSGDPQYVSSSEYTAGSAGANLGFYAIQLLDEANAVINTVDYGADAERKPNDIFNATVQVITGKNSAAPVAVPTGEQQDSTTNPTASSSVTLDMEDVVVTAIGNKYLDSAYTDLDDAIAANDVVQMNSNLNGTHSMRFRLNVANQVGFRYKLRVTALVSKAVGTTTMEEKIVGFRVGGATEHTSFRINAGAIYAAYGTQQIRFTQHNFPRIIRADIPAEPYDGDRSVANSITPLHESGGGWQAGMANHSGIPSPLHITFWGTGVNQPLKHANCYQCVQARLLMCADRLTAKTVYPLCSSVSQAVCATSSADGTRCAHGSDSGNPEWTNTLGGTTIVNLVNGTATFTDLKVQYVFGAGYRLQFMLNAGSSDTNGRSTTVYAPITVFSSGSVMVPDPSHSSGADPKYPWGGINNSFFVLPHHLDVLQQVGGDGVDVNTDAIPDGVGVGMVFRLQPAVVIKGDSYAFNKNWNTHGYAPVTASIYEKSCTVAPDSKNCKQRDVMLHGRITKPVWYALTFTAAAEQPAISPLFTEHAYYWKTTGNCEFPVTSLSECLAANIELGSPYQTLNLTTVNDATKPPYCFLHDADGERTILWNTDTSGPTTFTHDHATRPTRTLCKKHANSNDERDTVQMYYSSTLGGQVGMMWQDLRVYTNSTDVWQGDIRLDFRVGLNRDTDAFASVLSNPFDAFLAPDPPTNLRVTSYDDLGFRVEFEPSVVSRAQPLSGFIVEIDVCRQDTGNASCSTRQHPAYTGDSRYTITSALGSDLSAGGGMTVDVLVNFTNPVPGKVSQMDIYFKPELSIFAGDSIAINLGRTFRMLDNFDVTCRLEGPDGEKLTITNFDKDNMAFHLQISAGVLTATKPVYVTFPPACGITIPGNVANEREHSKFGIFVNPLPSILHAPVLGAVTSRRFDNCKGTGADLRSFDSSSGCDVTATYVLSTLQDASSMDTTWDGQLQFGGKSVACLGTSLSVDGSGNLNIQAQFPANRVCVTYSAESKCKDIGGVYDTTGNTGVCCPASCLACGGTSCSSRPGGASSCCPASVTRECAVGTGPGHWTAVGTGPPCRMTASTFFDTSTMQGSGDNGKPIGSNPGSGSATGSISSDSDAACR
jgi:hypothetical protein